MSVSFRGKRRGDHPGVDPIEDGVDDRYDKKQAGSTQHVEAAEPQDNGPVPLIRDLGGEGSDKGEDKGSSDKPVARPIG